MIEVLLGGLALLVVLTVLASLVGRALGRASKDYPTADERWNEEP